MDELASNIVPSGQNSFPIGANLLPREKLYFKAKALLGQSLVPRGDDPEVGCAIVVNIIHEQVFGDQIGGGTSTYNLWQALKTRSDFQMVDKPLPGDIIISPTGTQPDISPLSNGHTGYIAKYGILSNNSFTGRFEENYTLASWTRRYKILGRFPIFFYRKI